MEVFLSSTKVSGLAEFDRFVLIVEVVCTCEGTIRINQ